MCLLVYRTRFDLETEWERPTRWGSCGGWQSRACSTSEDARAGRREGLAEKIVELLVRT
jgi:hypothetical protein